MTIASDLNTSFYTSNANDKAIIEGVENIKKNLERIFSTTKGDIPFNREFGSSLKSLLFENNLDPSDVVMFLYMDITTLEPRVTLNPADILITQTGNNQFTVICDFVVPTLNNAAGTATTVLTGE